MKPDGITDRPIPPWELPGAFRRDGEPHRAGGLYCLARVTYGACSFALLLSVPGVVGSISGAVPWQEAEAFAAVTALFALPALLLGLTTLNLARRDLGLMLRGRMDPSGQDLTAIAAKMGREVVVFSLVILGGAAVVLLLARWRG